MIPRPLLQRSRRATGEARDRVGDNRRVALPGVGVQLDERGGLPLRLTARQEPCAGVDRAKRMLTLLRADRVSES